MAKDAIKVWVGSQHIERGLRRSKTHCPVALAINDKGLGPASVDMDRVSGGTTTFRTPPHVADAVMAFDEGRDVKPFVFEWPKGAIENEQRLALTRLPQGRLLGPLAGGG